MSNQIVLLRKINNIDFGDNYLKPLFFIIIGSLFNKTISTVLGIQTDHLLTYNIYIKHLFVLFVIYFSQELGSNRDDEVTVNPGVSLLFTIIIWIFIFMFSKLNVVFTIIIFVLLIISYIIDKYYKYYKDKSINKKLRKMLSRVVIYKKFIIGGVVIIGFVKHLLNARKRFGSDFSVTKYLE